MGGGGRWAGVPCERGREGARGSERGEMLVAEFAVCRLSFAEMLVAHSWLCSVPTCGFSMTVSPA